MYRFLWGKKPVWRGVLKVSREKGVQRGPKRSEGIRCPARGPECSEGKRCPTQGPERSEGKGCPTQGPKRSEGKRCPTQGPKRSEGKRCPTRGPEQPFRFLDFSALLNSPAQWAFLKWRKRSKIIPTIHSKLCVFSAVLSQTVCGNQQCFRRFHNKGIVHHLNKVSLWLS